MKKIILLVLPIIALIGGAMGGEMMRGEKPPSAEHTEATADHGPVSDDHAEQPAADDHADAGHGGEAATTATFTFPTQFFVPLMRNGDMGGMMIVTLSLETKGDSLAAMQQHEHRIRDALLRQLMSAANTGGFDGNFTLEGRQRPLREGLLKAAKQATDLPVTAVLIEDIARQGG